MNFLLSDPRLDEALKSGSGNLIRHIDATELQGIPEGLATGFENAGRSLERIADTAGNAQMKVSGAQMLASAELTGNQEMSQTAQDILNAPVLDESQLPQYKTFDRDQVGTAGVILGGLAQQTPSLAAMALNPLAGVALAAAQGQTEAHAEGAKLGLTGKSLENYGAVGALTSGAGAAIPGFTGFGRGAMLYGSRFVMGGLVNSATGEIDRWGRSAILDDAGFHDQARQMRQADAASRVTEFVLGGAFGLLGGRGQKENEPKISEPPEIAQALGEEPAPIPDILPTPLMNDHPPMESYIGNLQEKASNLMPRGDRKVWQSEVINSQRKIDELNQRREEIISKEITGSGRALAQTRRERSEQLAEIEQQLNYSQGRLDNAKQTLAPHLPGGEFYDAKAELSRIYQRQAEQISSVSSVHEDAAIANLLHDNYVTESAPGLATDAASEASHVRALDSAGYSVNAGRAVDVSEHINGDSTFLTHGNLDSGALERHSLSGDVPQKIDRIAEASDVQAMPQPQTTEPKPGVLSDTINNPFQVLREQIAAMRETHPELADVISPHLDAIEADHTTAHQESQIYDVAAACALKYGN